MQIVEAAGEPTCASHANILPIIETVLLVLLLVIIMPRVMPPCANQVYNLLNNDNYFNINHDNDSQSQYDGYIETFYKCTCWFG